MIGDTILAALEGLRRNGWTTGTRHDYDGKMCAIGAFEHLHGVEGHWGATQQSDSLAAMEVLAAHVPDDFSFAPECVVYSESYAAEPTCMTRVARYNNTRKDFSEIEEWFEKAAAEAGRTW